MTTARGSASRRRVRVLWNVNAGRKGGVQTNGTSRETLVELMRRFDLGDELIETVSEADAIGSARDAAAQGYDVVVAAGGDGSMGLVAEQLLGTGTALGILPLGSVMNIPRMLNLPRDLDEAAAVLGAGHVRCIDVGDSEGHVFYEAGSIGLHAAVFHEMPKVDHGDYAAIGRAIMAAFRYRPSPMTIELDGGRQVQTRALLVAIANGRYMGAGFTVAPDALLDDGLFDVRIFEHYSKWELVRHFIGIAFGRHAYAPRVRTERSRHVRVTGPRPLPVRADAQDLGTTPASFTVRPSTLLVVAPEPAPQG